MDAADLLMQIAEIGDERIRQNSKMQFSAESILTLHKLHWLTANNEYSKKKLCHFSLGKPCTIADEAFYIKSCSTNRPDYEMEAKNVPFISEC